MKSLIGSLIIASTFIFQSPVGAIQLTNINNADPSVITTVLNGSFTYMSVETDGRYLHYRSASSLEGLNSATPIQIRDEGNGNRIWAPELVKLDDVYYVYYAKRERMYVISSYQVTSNGITWNSPVKLHLPDNKWAIDGVPFKWDNKLWFVWSGWAGNENGQQNLYITEMTSPTIAKPGAARHLISQPTEAWETADDRHQPTTVNESPQPIKAPDGGLHIFYSANGHWDEYYCVAGLRLAADGDLTQIGDWWKSDGCLFGSVDSLMQDGYDPVHHSKGVGHHSFVLRDGDIRTSPPLGHLFPLAYHGVPNALFPPPQGTVFADLRYWYSGSFAWWNEVTYKKGTDSQSGWSIKFF